MNKRRLRISPPFLGSVFVSALDDELVDMVECGRIPIDTKHADGTVHFEYFDPQVGRRAGQLEQLILEDLAIFVGGVSTAETFEVDFVSDEKLDILHIFVDPGVIFELVQFGEKQIAFGFDRVPGNFVVFRRFRERISDVTCHRR